MARTVISGFDSAWTDNPRQPGAISHIIIDGDQRRFIAPELVTFRAALAALQSVADFDDTHLVALDQPTIVRNETGARPVDRVAGSLLSTVRSGAQPASRSRAGMFDEQAPIWQFLDHLAYPQLPWSVFEPRAAGGLRALIEVFPALSLLGLIPTLFERRSAARYNPAKRKIFDLADWVTVGEFVKEYAAAHRIEGLQNWARKTSTYTKPSKADQDRLDSVICALCGFHWLTYGVDRNTVVGDTASGYMVVATTADTHRVLAQAAEKRSLPVNRPWETYEKADVPQSAGSTNHQALPPSPSRSPAKTKSTASRPRGTNSVADFDQDRLEAILLDLGRAQQTITYGELAQKFGMTWSARVRTSLLRSLTTLAELDQRNGKPPLSALVVNKKEGLPGPGFNRFLDIPEEATLDQRQITFDRLLAAVFERCARR